MQKIQDRFERFVKEYRFKTVKSDEEIEDLKALMAQKIENANLRDIQRTSSARKKEEGLLYIE